MVPKTGVEINFLSNYKLKGETHSKLEPNSETFQGYVISGESSNFIMIDGSKSGVRGSFRRSNADESLVVLAAVTSLSQPLLLSRHNSSREISCILPPTAENRG